MYEMKTGKGNFTHFFLEFSNNLVVEVFGGKRRLNVEQHLRRQAAQPEPFRGLTFSE